MRTRIRPPSDLTERVQPQARARSNVRIGANATSGPLRLRVTRTQRAAGNAAAVAVARRAVVVQRATTCRGADQEQEAAGDEPAPAEVGATPDAATREPARPGDGLATADDVMGHLVAGRAGGGGEPSTLGTSPGTALTDVAGTGVGSGTGDGHAQPRLLRRGDRGPDVEAVQVDLNRHGEALDPDGIFGSLTDVAVRRFQTAHGLDVDGIVGPRTRAELARRSAGEAAAHRAALLAALRAREPLVEIQRRIAEMDPADQQALATDAEFLQEFAAYQHGMARRALLEHFFLTYHGHGASPAAVDALRTRYGTMFEQMDPGAFARTLGSGRLHVDVIPRNRSLTDLPPFTDLTGRKTHDGRPFENLRGVKHVSTVDGLTHLAIGEEEILGGTWTHVDPTTGARTQRQAGLAPLHTATHEMAHGIETSSLSLVQKQRLTALYTTRKAAHPVGPTVSDDPHWLTPAGYNASTQHEYFANGVAAWFRAPLDAGTAPQYTPEHLATLDPGLHALVAEVFGGSPGSP